MARNRLSANDKRLQELLAAAAARFPKQPTAELPLARWREALRLFDLPKKQAEAFAPAASENIVSAFSTRLTRSPYVMEVDSKAVVLDDEELVPLLERLGVATTFEAGRFEYRLRFAAGGQETQFSRSWSWDDLDFHGQVFDLERILPGGIAIFALVEFDRTDTAAYAFLAEEKWGRVRELLGEWFDCTFWKHPPDHRFHPIPAAEDDAPKKTAAKRRSKRGGPTKSG